MTEAAPLEISSPLRLALCLNYSSYKYEVEQQFDQAHEIAQTAFIDALNVFQSLDGQEQFETMKVMVLLEDNVALFEKAEQDQIKKAQFVEFDEERLNLLRQGFQEEDLVSLAGSMVSYDSI